MKSTASKAWSSVKKTASNIYNKVRTGLNNYMNSDTYKGYFDRAKSSGGGSRTGASTGNGYVGRNSGSGNVSGVGAGYRYYGGGSGGSSGGGVNGNTSYSYVKYRKTTPYKMTIGGKTRYFQTKAEMNTAKKVCSTAKRINKDEMSKKVNLVTKIFSNINYTDTKGINVSGTIGAWTYDASIGISIDFKGNIGIQYSYAGGVTASAGPSIAIAAYETTTNAPDIYTLEGDGASVGGAMVSSVSGIPAFVSGDIVIVGDVNSTDKHYNGVTGAVGVGVPEGEEMHIEISGTETVWSTNIKELFK